LAEASQGLLGGVLAEEVRQPQMQHRLCKTRRVAGSRTGLVVWDLDGTLIPADLRWLRRAVARTYELSEGAVVF
jgi:hypothetical protein